MVDFGYRLAVRVAADAVVFLRGELGAGKTTLARGLLHGLGHRGAVTSPTYTLVEHYALGDQAGDRTVHHFDLYRLRQAEELEMLGIRDLLGRGLCLFEWPERGQGLLPRPDLTVWIKVTGDSRQVRLEEAPGG